MEISCEEVRRELSNYIEDDVTRELRERINEHFARCSGCTALYDGVKNVLCLVTDGRVLELPPTFSQRLLRRLAAQLSN